MFFKCISLWSIHCTEGNPYAKAAEHVWIPRFCYSFYGFFGLLLRVVLAKIANYIFIKLQTFFDLVPESASEHGNQKGKKMKKKVTGQPNHTVCLAAIQSMSIIRTVNRAVVALLQFEQKEQINRKWWWRPQKYPLNDRQRGIETSVFLSRIGIMI